jgi:hypothetical protein
MFLIDSLGVIGAKVAVDVLRAEAVLQVVDDALVDDVGNGGARLQEELSVGPQDLILLLLDL